MKKYVHHLAEIIGPRPPTSENEHRAALYLRDILSPLADRVDMEGFRSPVSFSWTFILLCGITIMAAFTAHQELFWWGLPLSLVSLTVFVLEVNSWPLLSRLLPQKNSQNIIAHFKPIKKAQKTIVVTAHYDSSRAGIHFHPALVRGFRKSFLLLIFSLALIPLLIILQLALGPTAAAGYLMAAAAIYLLGNMLVLLHRELWGKDVAGGNDNASGVAVLLGLAESLKRNPLQESSVWLVATGCEEAGCYGLISLLNNHHDSLQGASLINLDNIGIGQMKYTTGEGMLKLFPSSPWMVKELQRLNTEKNLRLSPAENRLMNTDALAAMVRGLESISLRAEDSEGHLPHWHWITDTAERVSEENLVQALSCTSELMLSIDRER